MLVRRRPIARLAAGAPVGGAAYHAGKRRAEQDAYNEQAAAAYDATQGQPQYAASPYPPPQYQPQYQPTYQYQPNGQGYPPAMRVVNGGGGTIHQTPDSRSPLLGIVPPGYSVQVLGTVDGGWAHVVANGIDGYMSDNQLQ